MRANVRDSIKTKQNFYPRSTSSHLLTNAMRIVDIKCIAIVARARDHMLSGQFNLLDGTVLFASAIIHRTIGNNSSSRWTVIDWGWRCVLSTYGNLIIRLDETITTLDRNTFTNTFSFNWRRTFGRRHGIRSLFFMIFVSISACVCTFNIARVVVSIFRVIVNCGFRE